MIIELEEWSATGPLELTAKQVRALTSHDAFVIRPHSERLGQWSLGARHKVGAIMVEGLEIRIRPKVAVPTLLALLTEAVGRIEFDDDEVQFAESDQLLPILAGAFCHYAESAIRLGLLQGYQTAHEALLAVKGRLNLSAQVSRRAGMTLPVEVTHDEFTTDIIENRILAGAVQVLMAQPSVVEQHQLRLMRLRRRLDGVAPTRPSSSPPSVVTTRLNVRYADALTLARLILSAGALEDGEERKLPGTGLLVDMNRLFEDVVGAGLRRSLEALGGSVRFQDVRPLDVDGFTTIRPDLVCLVDGRPVAVIDAKYKLPTTRDIANSDIYQVLAYAARYELADVHLIYAEEPDRKRLQVGNVTIHLHHLDIGSSSTERNLSCQAISEKIFAPIRLDEGRLIA